MSRRGKLGAQCRRAPRRLFAVSAKNALRYEYIGKCNTMFTKY